MKALKSILDPYEETLLAMDEEKKTISEMLVWLKEKGIEPDRSTVSRFLTSRRAMQENADLLTVIKNTASQQNEVEEAFKKNPAPGLEILIKLHRVIIWKLTTGKRTEEMITLANRLTNTVVQYVSNQSRAKFKAREVKIAETKAEEWKKDDQSKALEYSLEETKAFPEAQALFKEAFDVLKRSKSGSLHSTVNSPQAK